MSDMPDEVYLGEPEDDRWCSIKQDDNDTKYISEAKAKAEMLALVDWFHDEILDDYETVDQLRDEVVSLSIRIKERVGE